MRVLHFGAGNIGRGLIGYILNKSGYEIYFVDVNTEIINNINNDHFYYVKTISGNLFKVDNVYALNSKTDNEKIIDLFLNIDLITTSVGANNLKFIVPILIDGIKNRIEKLNNKKIDIIANENIINASSILKKELENIEKIYNLDKYVGFVNSAIDRQSLSTIYENKNIPLVEDYYEWIINKNEIINESTFNIKDAIYVDNMDYYIERKLYCVNSSHAATAYMGYLYNLRYMKDAFDIDEILEFRKNFFDEIAQYFIIKYNANMEELNKYFEKVTIRHSNKNIKDEIARVGRDPIRKLGLNERFVAPYVKLFELDKANKYFARAIAAAFCFYNEDDNDSKLIREDIKTIGITDSIKKYTQLNDKNMIKPIMHEFEYLINKFNISI
ncbi:hypothetical protein [uncultured Brachyspira sp.]|uniref:mannitol dehydrogenase family protein n=1 Tax=uncultured Brachyspira sp. TaxID=221953 RepID=UPI0025D804B0|nr:hypothetical protein [uncultured Brachyspira sp.]